jgi:anthranilate phosphoribosyltransferase
VNSAEHPFAQFVRILGKGKTGTRSLIFDEARTAFGMILRGEVEPLQLGAFLMLLRVKEETPEELAGFVTACREFIGDLPVAPTPDLDWSSYAGKRTQPPWYLLSALLLADNGIRVLMHGCDGHTANRIYSEESLAGLGISPAGSLAQASAQLDRQCFAYLPLRNFCQPLHDIIELKSQLGLRSPVNTLARLLNPLAAPCSLQSVFHPAYASLHAEADQRLAQPRSLSIKGEGGEVEIRPQANTRCVLLANNVVEQFEWPRCIEGRQPAATELDPAALLQLWLTDAEEEYALKAVTETAACALLLLQRADSIEAARTLANQWWTWRDRERFV